MKLKGGKGYTLADIEALPEGERAELIDGEMFRMDAPLRIHQDIVMELSFEIKSYIRKNKGNCKVYAAPFAVRIKKDNLNYVEPDISVVCDHEKLDEKGCYGAPDWVIEILSPSSVKMDCERKVKLYCETGVREYWIVDPEKETVTVYDFAHSDTAQPTDGACALAAESWNKPMLYSFTKQVKAGIFENLWLDFSKLDLN
ncbi:Uma2 family endonuclease [bacterium 1xD42-87]|nr:Uma2 family endonuclease [bacterium 1xD42-87]